MDNQEKPKESTITKEDLATPEKREGILAKHFQSSTEFATSLSLGLHDGVANALLGAKANIEIHGVSTVETIKSADDHKVFDIKGAVEGGLHAAQTLLEGKQNLVTAVRSGEGIEGIMNVIQTKMAELSSDILNMLKLLQGDKTTLIAEALSSQSGITQAVTAAVVAVGAVIASAQLTDKSRGMKHMREQNSPIVNAVLDNLGVIGNFYNLVKEQVGKAALTAHNKTSGIAQDINKALSQSTDTLAIEPVR